MGLRYYLRFKRLPGTKSASRYDLIEYSEPVYPPLAWPNRQGQRWLYLRPSYSAVSQRLNETDLEHCRFLRSHSNAEPADNSLLAIALGKTYLTAMYARDEEIPELACGYIRHRQELLLFNIGENTIDIFIHPNIEARSVVVGFLIFCDGGYRDEMTQLRQNTTCLNTLNDQSPIINGKMGQ